MSPDAASAVTVPARATVSQLAEALGRDVEEIRRRLAEMGSPLLPQDHLDADTARAVARSLGLALNIEARDLALELLYQVEAGGEPPDPAALGGKVGILVQGVLGAKESLDEQIEAASQHWSIARMPVIDRTILRIGLYELRHSPDTPTAVVISEAVRLAQTYSTERSGAFVNGVLAALARGR